MKIIISKGKVTIEDTLPSTMSGAKSAVSNAKDAASPRPLDLTKITKNIGKDTEKQSQALQQQQVATNKAIQALNAQISQLKGAPAPKPGEMPKEPPKHGEKPEPNKTTEPQVEQDPARVATARKAAEAAARNNPAQRAALSKAVTQLSAALAVRPQV